MRCVAILLIAFVFAAFAHNADFENANAITQEMVDSVNAQQAGWRASAEQSSFFAGATNQQVRKLLGYRPNANRAPRRIYNAAAVLPDNFLAADKWPNCPSLKQVRDQSACGSCWAFGAAEAITDRYCTYGGPANLTISANNLVACCSSCGDGCNGGDPDSAFSYWVSNGLVDDSCDPYPFPRCEHHTTGGHYPACPSDEYPTPSCSKTCKNGASWDGSKHFGSNSWSLQGESDYMNEVYNHGPFEVAFTVYQDFLTYKSGVYRHVSGSALGGHAVKLVGWGVLNGTKYWRIANSWNEDWGDHGFFNIARGTDECGIEDSGSAGSPKL